MRSPEAQPTIVQYMDGTSHRLRLCTDCSNTFQTGSFIEKLVVPKDE